MVSKAIFYYIIFFISVLFFEMIFPFNFPYVRILVVLNIVMLIISPKFIRPKKGFLLYLVIIFLFFLSAFISGISSDFLSRDIANIVLLTTFVPIYYFNISDNRVFLKFKDSLFKSIYITSVLVALIGFYKFYILTTTGQILPYFGTEENGVMKFRLGTSLVGDYNYYAYGLFMGLTIIPFLYNKTKSKIIQALFIISFMLIAFNILFSSSRRGIILLLLYVIVLLIRFLFKRRRSHLSKLKFKLLITIGIIGLFFVVKQINDVYDLYSSSTHLEKLLTRMESTEDKHAVTSERMIRINESLILIKEFNGFQLLIGDGFNYLTKIGEKTSRPEDYPHNYLISALLYGGIITLIITSFFTYIVGRLYRKNNKSFNLFFVWYCFGVFMLLTSKNSIFSVQFILLLFLLPLINNKKSLNNENIRKVE